MPKIISIMVIVILLFWLFFDESNQKNKMTQLVLNDNLTVIDDYILKNGKSPPNLKSLSDIGINKFDAWGNEFIYKKCGDSGYLIYSAGANKIADDSDDVKNKSHANCN